MYFNVLFCKYFLVIENYMDILNKSVTVCILLLSLINKLLHFCLHNSFDFFSHFEIIVAKIKNGIFYLKCRIFRYSKNIIHQFHIVIHINTRVISPLSLTSLSYKMNVNQTENCKTTHMFGLHSWFTIICLCDSIFENKKVTGFKQKNYSA